MSRVKALALLSGGLDSLLAIKLVQAEGVEIEGICFTSPFFGAERAEKGSRYLGISLHRQQIGQELISLLRSPPHGFGKGANPCIDCHILMIKKAGDLMRRRGLDFLISGEVLGQRPKSQSRWALELISRKSEWGDLLLRPLTAKNLSPTLAERKGWVRREKLWGIKGRSRLSQLELASKFGLKDFPAPSGGCLLTDPIFSRRMKDLLSHSQLDLWEAELLKVGRHFRLNTHTRAIVGRNQKENSLLLKLTRPGELIFRARDYPGPVALLKGEFEEEEILKVASLTLRYSDVSSGPAVVEYKFSDSKEKKWVEVVSLSDEEVDSLRIGGEK